jgi:hypothetical protein
MSNQFLKLRRSSVPGKIPTTESIDFGEIALNTYDGLAFMKKSGSNGEEVIPIGLGALDTGSFVTTSSFNAFTASYNTGSFLGNLEGTSSWAISSSYAITASYALNVPTIDLTGYTTTASFNAFTASYNTGSFTGSFVGNLIGTASWASNAVASDTASYVNPLNQVLINTGSVILYGNQSAIGGNRNTLYLRNRNTAGNQSNMIVLGSNTTPAVWSILNDINADGTAINQLDFYNTALGYSPLILKSDGVVNITTTVQANKYVFTDGVINTNQSGQKMLAVGGDVLFLYTGLNGLNINNQNNSAINVAIGDSGTVQTRGTLTVGAPGNDQSMYFGGTNAGLYWASSGASIVYSVGVLNFSSVGSSNNMVLQNGGGALFNYGITGSLLGTASYSQNATTASYAPGYLPLTGGTINGDVIVNGTASVAFLNVTYESASVIYSSGSNIFGNSVTNTQTLIGTVVISGSQQITGSLNAPSITGSLYGTASWAQNAITASYITSSAITGTVTSASYAMSSSNAISSSYSVSSSYALSSSYSLSSSYALSSSQATSASYALSSSYATSASYSLSSSYALSASYTLSSSYAVSASRAVNANNASLAGLVLTQNSNTNQDYSVVFAPSGANGYLQTYTDGGSNLLYNPSTDRLTVPNLTATSITGSLQGTASYATISTNIQGGTTNYIPLWSGATTLTSSMLYQTGSILSTKYQDPSNFDYNTPLLIDGNTQQTLLSTLGFYSSSFLYALPTSIALAARLDNSGTGQQTANITATGNDGFGVGKVEITTNGTASISSQVATINGGDKVNLLTGNNTYFTLDNASGGTVTIGDVNDGVNGTKLIVDDGNSIIKTKYYFGGSSQDAGLYLDFAGNQYTLIDSLNGGGFSLNSGDIYISNAGNQYINLEGGSIHVRADSLYLDNLPTLPQSNVVTIDTATGKLYYTASSAFGGGGAGFPFSGSAVITGSLLVSGSGVTVTGSLNANSITGSLFGTASWAISASQAVSSSYALTASYVNTLNQGVVVSGAIRLDPTTDPSSLGNTFISSSFLFQSSSNTSLGYDLYIRQDGNLVKWKWVEGALQTGLLYGGALSYSSTTASISSGSGIIVNYNASTGSEISPIIQYVTWPSQSIKLGGRVTSSQATYIYIDSNGVAQSQDDTFFTNDQYAQSIPLGMVNHTGRDIITSVANNVYTAYNITNQAFDFIETFGPLKVTGLTVTGQTGTLRLNVGAGESFILGGFYQQDPQNISHKSTSAYNTASIARVYRSGSTFTTDNNGGSFYTVVDPTKYDQNGNGTLSNVGGGSFTIQRVFFNPFTGRVHVYYGQKTYNNIADARANLASDPFNEAVYTAHQYVFVAYLLVNGGATDLTNTNDCVIVQSGIFRNTAGSSGATTFTTRLTDLSDVSITSPTTNQALVYSGGTWINGTPVSASNAVNAQTASYVLNAISSSFATTASTADNFTVRGNLIVSGNVTMGDATTDSITLNAATMSLGSGTGILNIDSNTLYVDGANNLVGIGKIPANNITLDVNGTFRASSTMYGSSILINTILPNTTDLKFASGSTSNTVVATMFTSSGNFVFQSSQSATDLGYRIAINGPSVSGSLYVSGTSVFNGNVVATGSVTATSFTGSLQGTASWASNALTASYVTASAIVGTVTSASYALTSSYAANGGVTQIVAGTGISISPTTGIGAVTINSTSAAGANITASFSNQSTWTFVHGLGNKGVVVQTYDSSWNQTIPQSIVLTDANTATITFPTNESGYAIATLGGTTSLVNAISASYATTASYISNAVSASYATTASYVLNAVSASYATTASYLNPLSQAVTISTGSLTLTTGSITMPNRPAFRVTGNGGGTTAISYLSGSKTTVDYNQGSYYNNTTGVFTAPISGLYQVCVVCRTNSNSLGTISQLIVYKNNTTISPSPDGTPQVMVEYNSNTSMNHAGGSTISYLAAGDTLRMVVAVGQISFDGNDNFSVAYIG